ncbi:apolipoprotein D-like [Cherax quadricarinatus]
MLQSVVMVLVACMLGEVHPHKLFRGKCPVVTPVTDFNMTKFEGLWYVLESFDDREACVTWNISQGHKNGTWHMKEVKGSGVLNTLGIYNTEATTATLKPNPDNPAKMKISWPLNIGGSYDYTVHMVDYEKVAGVFMCQRVLLFQRQNGIVLSRTPHLSNDLQQTARLLQNGVQVEYYKPVKQAHCGYLRNTTSVGAGSPDPGPLGV